MQYEEDQTTPETEPKGDLQPPRRRPPTAVGTALTPSGGSGRPLRIAPGRPRGESFLYRVLLGFAEILEDARRMVVRVVNR
jgi:hypothetical protein